MANFNKVILIGRLTRDPEVRTFATGGKVAKIGFAVTNRRKNSQTGQWEDEPMFIDVDFFNRGEFGKLADIIEQYCRKGSQICIEGKLHLDQWDDKTSGQKRSKHKIVGDAVQLLDGRPQDGGGGDGEGGGYQSSRPAAHSGSARTSSPPAEEPSEAPVSGNGEDIPF